MGAEEGTFNRIIEAIQNIGETGATIDELSEIVHLERHTLSKYLSQLRADGRLSYKRIGRAKVWFVSKAPLQHIFRLSEDEKTYTEKILSRILSDMPEGVLVMDFDYNILFMNRHLITIYGDCIGQKFYHAIFDALPESPIQSKIRAIIDSKDEEIEYQTSDKKGRTLEIKARKAENPDGSSSIIVLISDTSEKVRREERIKHLSELHRLLGESVNRSYTMDQLCSTILENVRSVISYDMGDILIYNMETNRLTCSAEIGYPDTEENGRKEEVENWKKGIVRAVNQRRGPAFIAFNKDERNKEGDELTSSTNNLAQEYNLQEMYVVPLKTKGEHHGALLILTGSGRKLSEEDRSLIEGVSEEIAGGIAKIKAEEELRVKASAIEISINPVFMADMAGKLTYVNPSFLEMWCYDTEKEVLGCSCTEFWKQRADVDILTEVLGKGIWIGKLIGVRKDGSEFKTRLSTSLILGTKGPLQFVAVAESRFASNNKKEEYP
uniref:PAS domain-containing protein n=1 Tax=Candidatus Methanophaga sp. ANME-1 ERB7 TaxID=2759913 RepID=A0A7G9Z4W8_9EURY|nr:hypothetical protein NDMCNHHP_00002 [Methanosarcinales archaeon ANME-1 ERB7]